MIDVSKETIVTFPELPQIYRERGREVSIPTVYRWALRGLCGVRLERTVKNGQICTSLEALDRFDVAVEKVKLGPQVITHPAVAGAKQTSKAHARATSKLAASRKSRTSRA